MRRNYQKHDHANQRTRVTQVGDFHRLYQSDTLGQVTSGKRFWADGIPVAGQQFEYGFDDIGNRQTAAHGGNAGGSNLRLETYTANDLNQYTQRTIPGFAEVQGRARSDATVTVNLQARRGAHPPSGVVFRALTENPCGTGGAVASGKGPRTTVLDAGAHPATPEGGCAPRTAGRELMTYNSASPRWHGHEHGAQRVEGVTLPVHPRAVLRPAAGRQMAD